MKATILSLLASIAAVAGVQAADVSVKLSDVHLCCQSCVDGAQKAIAPVSGVKADISLDDEIITLTGPDTASLQKATDALVAAGYFGTSSDPSVKVVAATGAKGQKVQTLKIEGVHLCCGKCAAAVDKAVKSVPGVNADTAKKNAKSFEVTGDFNDQAVFDALQKAGLTGKVAN